MFTWLNKSQPSQLGSITQHAEGLAFASIAYDDTQKPVLKKCIFQPQLSDSKTTLHQLLQQFENTKQPITTLLDANQFLLLLMQRPGVEEEELSDAVRWQIKDQLKYPAEEAIIEILEIPGQQQRGRMPMIYVIVAHRDNVKSSIKFIEDADLNLQYVDIPELAQRNISSLLAEDSIGAALLNIQATQSLLTITHEGELYLSRVIDIGYEHLEEYEATEQDDTELSLEETQSESENNIDTIVLEIQRSLDYYESHYGKAAIGNLVLAPLENNIPNLNDQLTQNLGVAVRNLDLNNIVNSKINIEPEIQAKCFNAIGAALRLTENTTSNNTFDKDVNNIKRI